MASRQTAIQEKEKMTEEETFRRLKRSTFEEVEAHMVRLLRVCIKSDLDAFGWTEREYLVEHYRRMKLKNE